MRVLTAVSSLARCAVRETELTRQLRDPHEKRKAELSKSFDEKQAELEDRIRDPRAAGGRQARNE